MEGPRGELDGLKRAGILEGGDEAVAWTVDFCLSFLWEDVSGGVEWPKWNWVLP